MEEKSRTEYSAKNTTISLFSQILYMVFGYIARIIFTHVFNEDYVGINGLFLDILSVLSISELGFGTAITFALYKPIADKDYEKQKTLLQLFKKIYRIIALIILICGLILLPFLGVLMKNIPDVEHIQLIYLIYLFNSVASYIAIYKKTIISAHQLSYIPVLIQTLFWTGQNIIMIIVLLTTRNFLLYISINLFCTIGTNLVISHKANQLFPYIKEKNIQSLDKEERSSIVKNVKAMFLHKISGVLVNNSDNLLLSSIVGTGAVGKLSNYYLLITSAKSMLTLFFEGITASVGNLGATENNARIKKIFEGSFFLGQWIYGLVSICMFAVINDFVKLSFGAQYVFSEEITFVLCLNFYIEGMRKPAIVFRDSMGLFYYDRYKAIPEVIINLGASIVLAKLYGTIGVFIGTTISSLTTSVWVEPFVLYKYKLKSSSVFYFVRFAIYTVTTLLIGAGTIYLCSQVNSFITYDDSPLLYIIIRAVISFTVVNFCYFILYSRTKEFKLLKEKGLYLLKKKFKK